MPLHFLVDSGSAIIVISAGTSVEVKAKCIHCEMLCVNICNSRWGVWITNAEREPSHSWNLQSSFSTGFDLGWNHIELN